MELLLQHSQITESQLRRVGLLADKAIATTTDLYDYELTSLGKRYFTKIKSHELIMLKPDMLTALLKCLTEPVQE